jgi:multicomponent Na+:H+ antiporter subunit D
MADEALLRLALLIPLTGAALIVVAGRWPNLRETVTLLAAGGMFAAVLQLAPRVLAGARPEVVWTSTLPAVPLHFAVEPLGMLFAVVASGLWIVNSIYSIGYMRGNDYPHQTRFYAYFALALASTMGVAFAGNLFTLFLFYEALTLSTYPLVTHHGTPEAVRAGRLYLALLLGTSIGLLLVAIVWTWIAAGTLDFTAGGILAGKVEGGAVGALLALYMFGIGKAALMPVHRWLPAAMVAPTPVSALLHAVAVVKAGVFAIVKVIVYVFGIDLLRAEPSANWLLYIAGATILIASVIALRSGNLKQRLAYSTVSQLAYVVLAAAVLAPLSVIGAVLHIAAHALGKITLFFTAGAIYTAGHKTEVSELDGIGRRMPWTMAAFTIGSLSMIGLPPTVGFLSKWYMLLGAAEAGQWTAVSVIVLSTLLNAAYFLPIVYAAFFKTAPDAGSAGDHGEAPASIVLAQTLTALACLALFFLPEASLQLARQMLNY